MAVWYCGSVQYAAVTQFATSHAYSVGDIVRQLAAPAVGSERCFRCTTAGTSAVSEPAWNLTKGSTTTSGTAVFTEVTGNATYNWAAPMARLQHPLNSASWMASGDILAVAHNHAETQATAMTIGGASNGTVTTPLRVICVNAAGSVPPVSADLRTTAAVDSTSSSGAITFSTTSMYFYGIIFTVGAGGSATCNITNGSGSGVRTFENCSMRLASTGAGSNFAPSNSTTSNTLILINTTFQFGNVGNFIAVNSGQMIWRDTPSAVGGATIPTSLMSFLSAGAAVVQNVDLSALGSGKKIVDGSNGGAGSITLIDCKLGASVTIASSPASFGGRIDAINCDSAGTTYRNESWQYAGALTTETTIVRSGGASDGTQTYSWKLVTNANTSFYAPFECPPMVVWTDDVGVAKTVVIDLVNDGTTLKDDEVWAEVSTLDTSGAPIATLHSTARADPLATAANVATSTSTWTTTGLSSPVKQKLSVTFTPQIAGYIRIIVKFGKASKTIYVDPAPQVS